MKTHRRLRKRPSVTRIAVIGSIASIASIGIGGIGEVARELSKGMRGAALSGSLLLLGIGCAGLPRADEIPVTPEMLRDAVDTLPVAQPGALRVALAFAGDSDLDLAVTNPELETIRFASPRGARGGRFSADRGCGDPAPRVEIVSWDEACPGRYEITIEHTGDCETGTPPSPRASIGEPTSKPPTSKQWQLRIDHNGVEWKEGRIESSAFVPIVFEVERTSVTPSHCSR